MTRREKRCLKLPVSAQGRWVLHQTWRRHVLGIPRSRRNGAHTEGWRWWCLEGLMVAMCVMIS